MDKHINLSEFQKALGGAASKYKITDTQSNEVTEHAKSWFESYKPLLLIFAYITILTILIQLPTLQLHAMDASFYGGFLFSIFFF